MSTEQLNSWIPNEERMRWIKCHHIWVPRITCPRLLLVPGGRRSSYKTNDNGNRKYFSLCLFIPRRLIFNAIGLEYKTGRNANNFNKFMTINEMFFAHSVFWMKSSVPGTWKWTFFRMKFVHFSFLNWNDRKVIMKIHW